MIITEEEFREQRKIAIERLDELKKIEASMTKFRHVLPSERALEDFFIDTLFDQCEDEIVYIF